jgi:hypothetical protein
MTDSLLLVSLAYFAISLVGPLACMLLLLPNSADVIPRSRPKFQTVKRRTDWDDLIAHAPRSEFARLTIAEYFAKRWFAATGRNYSLNDALDALRKGSATGDLEFLLRIGFARQLSHGVDAPKKELVQGSEYERAILGAINQVERMEGRK